MQLLKIATSNSNLVYNLGLGSSLPKNNALDQNWRGSWPREHPKNLGPPTYFATVKANDFKFGTQIGFGTKKRRLVPKLAGVWAREHPKKFGTPYLFMQPLKLATSNLVHNLGLGLAYQKNDV